jgi:hypothetical protein
VKRLLVAVIFLAGCAANAQPAPQSSVLSVSEMRALLPAHPLYRTLAQYDRQIKALRATLYTREFQHAGNDIDASIAALRSDIDAAAASVDALVRKKADEYAARQDAAVSALLANAQAPAPTSADVRAHLQQAYQAEYAQLRSGADRDMASYESALQAQQRQAYGAFVQSVQNHTQQAYNARAQELREQESTLLLNLARKHSAQRLQLRAKLQTLYLRPEQRAAYKAQLAALQRSEERALAAMHARNAGILAAYRERLLSQADSDIAKTAAELQSRTAANLAARRDVLAAQRTAAAGALPVNAPRPKASPGAPANLRAEVAAMRNKGRADFTSAAHSTVTAYNAARDDLTNRFTALRQENDESTKATQAQIAALQRDRDALYVQMTTQIADDAKKQAQRCHCTDVTAAVRKDLQTLL